MSGVSTAFVWDHRGRTRKNAEGPIEYRVTIDRKSWYVATGVKCLRSEWKFGVVVDRPDANQLNERLRLMAGKIQDEINRCIELGEQLDVSRIRKEVWKPLSDGSGREMIEWMKDKVGGMKINWSTRDHYDVTISRLEEIGLTSWSKMTADGLKRWDEYLRGLKAMRGRQKSAEGVGELSASTLSGYHSKLKRLLSLAVREGVLKQSPYDVWKPELKKVRYDIVDYLSEDELKAFLEWSPKTVTEKKAKDLFTFQCFTGLAFADTQKFDIKNYKMENGKWIATARRIKTGVPFVNVLLPPVVGILERNEWKVPKMCLDWYNEVLERIGKRSGMSIKLRSHVARHTFATMMLRNGVKIENLARMLGHTNITQTQRYAKVLAMSVQEEFEMIENKMFH